MPDKPEKPRWFRAGVALGAILVLILGFFARQLPPDGNDRSDLAQFFGRFHPLLIHLPIALILVVPVMEIAAAFGARAHLRQAAGFILWLAAAGALVAAFDGWLLARSGGYNGPLVTRHMWGGVMLCALCLLTAAVRGSGRRGPIYGILLVGTVGLMAWTSHEGGGLVQGQDFLTQFMPRPLRSILGIPQPKPKPPPVVSPAAAKTFYVARITPILNDRCVSCHGPKKVKGDLRLDTYAGILDGGEDGDVITPWLPSQSEIVRRITLPPDDDDFMPTGKKPLTPDQVKTIEQWIAAGASDKEPAELDR